MSLRKDITQFILFIAIIAVFFIGCLRQTPVQGMSFQEEVSNLATDISLSESLSLEIIEPALTELSVVGSSIENEEKTEPQGYIGLSDREAARLQNSRHKYYITINRQRNVIVIYERGSDGKYSVPVRAILVSTGDGAARDRITPVGLYEAMDKHYWRFMFDGSYCQYITRVTGHYMMHSVPYWTRDKSNMKSEMFLQLGQSVSGGCIRMTAEDAMWIFYNCPTGTFIRVFDHPDDGPLGRPAPVPFDINSPNRGWDPTDPDPANPWRM